LIAASLDRLIAAAARQRSAVAAILGVTPTDVLALQHVARRQPLTPTGLSERLRLSSSGTTAVINRLAAAGLVTREADPANRRRVLLRPAPRAAALSGEFYGPLRADIDSLASALTPEARALTEQFLARLADLGERHADRTVTESEVAASAAIDVPSPVRWG
jgi:DNA-binding MarR family transcriptional regulator